MEVSVVIASYNQIESLWNAVDSVLMQKNVSFEIIIADDGSIDGSVDVIKQLTERHSNIVPMLHEHVGINENMMRAFYRCRGKYIAICDADDFWLDPFKLQKQFEYMEKNPLCGACFTKVVLWYDDGRKPLSKIPSEGVTYSNLLRTGYPMTTTIFMRSEALKPFWQVLEKKRFFIYDYPMFLYLLKTGYIAYLDEVTAVYCQTSESFTRTKSRSRWRRWLYVWGYARIKLYFITRYGCEMRTLLYLVYRFGRDVVSIALRRWYGR